ncbi:DUF6153 family protein [Streptomyces sp. OfavH-34-F]|uniref:DUF6153 family protein n=1 Tax=Streptomyces sp. OfavH-34-F TaxID=2917760 RepID=UPI0023B8769D|nr:DUF6153 family protein [Streptomyces sp. OfavH-34-F]
MARRAARSSGGTVLRWVYGVLGTLCIALAVLVHHETVAPAMPPMPATGMPSTSSAGHDAHVVAGWAGAPVYGNGSDGCGMSGMQHCTAAGVGSVQLAVPGQSPVFAPADLHQAVPGSAPAGAVGRAPPDLSVLSQLRI